VYRVGFLQHKFINLCHTKSFYIHSYSLIHFLYTCKIRKEESKVLLLEDGEKVDILEKDYILIDFETELYNF